MKVSLHAALVTSFIYLISNDRASLVDPKTEFPDRGLSTRNLWNMKRFYERYARYANDDSKQKEMQFRRICTNPQE